MGTQTQRLERIWIMTYSIDRIEARRSTLQEELDGQKTLESRNREGQFATPPALAQEILKQTFKLLPKSQPVHFLDPAVGTGSFFSALLLTAGSVRIRTAVGYELDPHYGLPSRNLWQDSILTVRLEDFTTAQPPHGQKASLLVCNPPYVRHHHIDSTSKSVLRQRAHEACGVRFGGLSGLYCYFIGLAHRFMADGCVAAWLVPSEFMDVNYGRAIKEYLLERVTLLRIHRYDPDNAQFDDALVSSAVVWFKNKPPPKDHHVTFTFGGSLSDPSLEREIPVKALAAGQKWTRYPSIEAADITQRAASVTLGDLFNIKRGIVTGDNSFFIMTREQVSHRSLPMECFTPVLPSSRYINTDEIKADNSGLPALEKVLFLLNTRLPEEEIAERFPVLKDYLESGTKGEKPVSERYLCRSRRPWYAQEKRPPAPLVCTYMGRGKAGKRPFRFILNHSMATASNVYLLLYPKAPLADSISSDPKIIRTVWKYLNETNPDEFLACGRVYGGGLYKLEPRELARFPADGLVERLPTVKLPPPQRDLFGHVVQH